MNPARPIRAFVRRVPASYARCLRENDEPIDLARTRIEHAKYVAALEAAGIAVEYLPTLDEDPDSVFVEDAAVVTGGHALLTRPGAPSRRSEVESLRAPLSSSCEIHAMEAPATLDGGDVLRISESRLLVGISSRTNDAGALALSRVAALDGLELSKIRIAGGLHLKSLCTLISGGALVFHGGSPPELGLELVEAPEPAGANVLALGELVLVSARAPKTRAILEARGVKTASIDVDQFHAGDGALTCLSIRIPPAGGWCA